MKDNPTFGQLMERLRGLEPGGTRPVIKLTLPNFGYVDIGLFREAGEELEKLVLTQTQPSALEKIAIQILYSTAGFRV